MYDLERIARAIADIERYFVDMESLNIKDANMSNENSTRCLCYYSQH